MFSLITALVAAASLAAALPGSGSSTAEPSPTIPPPLDPDAAASIFEYGDLHTVSQAVTNLITVQATPHPTPDFLGVPPKPRPVGVKPPSKPRQSTPPGLPSSGGIQVQPQGKIPIGSVIGHNRSSIARGVIDSRQACSQSDSYCCPDPRYLNENTNFPYNVIGKIITPAGSCTGTLVGPSLVLTAAHCIDWINCRESIGEVQFIPDYWPGHEPDGIFYGCKVAYYDSGACGDPTNGLQQGLDIVVITLSENTGLPWMGTTTYNTAWNGGNYWYEQGYAANAGGANYPYIQGPFPVLGEFSEGDGSYLLEYANCNTPGDSGSPVWGWWSGGPSIIGMTTLEGSVAWGPGGPLIAELIAQQYPASC